MLKTVRELFTALLILALPLQGQAAASMTCHLMTKVSGPVVALSADSVSHHGNHSSHEPAHLNQTADHSNHSAAQTHPDLIPTEHGTDQGSRFLSLNDSVCAACAAACLMAHALPEEITGSDFAANSSAVLITTPSPYAGVILDGPLRPPRS